MLRKILNIALIVLLSAASSAAQSKLGNIRISGRAESTVLSSKIALQDIADVSSPSVLDDEAVIALKRIIIADAPKAGDKMSFGADQIIQSLKRAGVDLEVVGYSLPRTLSVARAGRTVTSDEVQAAIESVLEAEKRGATIRSINYKESAMVAPGDSTIQARTSISRTTGQRGFDISVTAAGEPATTFKVTAIVDEWREIPVALRAIPRGDVIGSTDVVMARLNATQIPQDAASDLHAVVGLAAKTNLGYGEPISRAKLALPTLVANGSKVTISYRSKFLEATATGLAIQAGGAGETIRVRNDASNKIVEATVVEPGLVTVSGGE